MKVKRVVQDIWFRHCSPYILYLQYLIRVVDNQTEAVTFPGISA
jgi:hypothetical protein